jgi:hypothetical protein
MKTTFAIDGYDYFINTDGGVSDDNSEERVTAKELDQLAALSDYLHKQKLPKFPTTLEARHDVGITFEGSGLTAENLNGAIFIGCQRVEHKQVMLAHRISLHVRKQNRRKKAKGTK